MKIFHYPGYPLLVCVCVCVCACVHMCVGACTHMHVCAHMCESWNSMLRVFLRYSPLYFLRQGLSLKLELVKAARLVCL